MKGQSRGQGQGKRQGQGRSWGSRGIFYAAELVEARQLRDERVLGQAFLRLDVPGQS